MKNKRFGIDPVRPSTPAISTLVRAADSVVDPHAAACCVQRKRRARRRARTSLTHHGCPCMVARRRTMKRIVTCVTEKK